MSGDMQPTLELLTLLHGPIEARDQDWTKQFEEVLFDAILAFDHEQPYRMSPDGIPIFLFRQPPDREEFVATTMATEIDDIVHWIAGAQILDLSGAPLITFSPGDIVSLWIHKSAHFRWGGHWMDPIDVEGYREGGTVVRSTPNPDFLHPLAARCLETGIKRVTRGQQDLEQRHPGVCGVRLGKYEDKNEYPSDLTINLGSNELEHPERLPLLWDHLPRHVANRLMLTPKPLFALDEYSTLRSLYSEEDIPASASDQAKDSD